MQNTGGGIGEVASDRKIVVKLAGIPGSKLSILPDRKKCGELIHGYAVSP